MDKIVAKKIEGNATSGLFHEAAGLYTIKIEDKYGMKLGILFQYIDIDHKLYRELMVSEYNGQVIQEHLFFKEEDLPRVLEWHENALLMTHLSKSNNRWDF